MKVTKTIHLIAFKPSGKYYSHYPIVADVETFTSGHFILMQSSSIRDAITVAIQTGQLPSGFIYTLNMLMHPDEVPALFPIE